MDTHGHHSGGRRGASPLMTHALGAMSFITLLMTIPQVLAIWVSQQAAGVSVISWSTYLASAVLWLVHGLQQGDKNIYLPCIGWIGLDAAIVAGVLIHG